MSQQNILDNEALNGLLRRNWTVFLDKTRLLAFLMQEVREVPFPPSDAESTTAFGVKLGLSRIEPTKDGFILWVDFSIPAPNHTAKVGTCEAILSYSGSIRPITIVGQTIKLK